MTKHAMEYEGRRRVTRDPARTVGVRRKGSRKAVKTKKRGSAISGQLRAAKRQAVNILAVIGLITSVIVLFQTVRGVWVW